MNALQNMVMNSAVALLWLADEDCYEMSGT